MRRSGLWKSFAFGLPGLSIFLASTIHAGPPDTLKPELLLSDPPARSERLPATAANGDSQPLAPPSIDPEPESPSDLAPRNGDPSELALPKSNSATIPTPSAEEIQALIDRRGSVLRGSLLDEMADPPPLPATIPAEKPSRNASPPPRSKQSRVPSTDEDLAGDADGISTSSLAMAAENLLRTARQLERADRRGRLRQQILEMRRMALELLSASDMGGGDTDVDLQLQRIW